MNSGRLRVSALAPAGFPPSRFEGPQRRRPPYTHEEEVAATARDQYALINGQLVKVGSASWWRPSFRQVLWAGLFTLLLMGPLSGQSSWLYAATFFSYVAIMRLLEFYYRVNPKLLGPGGWT